MSDPVRIAVVGAGIMGANHARVAHQLPSTELIAVVDPDQAKVEAIVRTNGALALSSIDQLPDTIEAAVVAVPTAFHVETALALLARGIHVLVEKPLAPTAAEAQRIVDAARAANCVLAVGHIERFNAAVVELPRLLDRPIHIEASRISPYSARIADGVIFDLMIHDIDIVCSLAGPDDHPVTVSGVARATRGATEDIATITVGFASGLTATFNTSRLGQQKIRSIEITQEESTVIADLVRQDVTVHRMTRHEYLSEDGARYRQSSVVEIPFLDSRGEPLALELAHFAECVRTGGTPRVDGAAAIRAIELATRATEVVAASLGASNTGATS
jgi:predicted dehydrogenase